MEKKSTPAELSRAIRSALGLTQSELATRLLLSRNYISHIEAGLKSPSVRILVQMEAMLSEATSRGGPSEHSNAGAVEEPQAPYLPSGAGGLSDPALAITEEIQAKVCAVVTAANGDPSRLGWINEQLAQHLRPPAHWPKVTPRADSVASGIVAPAASARSLQRGSASA